MIISSVSMLRLGVTALIVMLDTAVSAVVLAAIILSVASSRLFASLVVAAVASLHQDNP